MRITKFFLLFFSLSIFIALFNTPQVAAAEGDPPIPINGQNFWLTYDTAAGTAYNPGQYISMVYGNSRIVAGPTNVIATAIDPTGHFATQADFVVEGTSALATMYTANSVFPDAKWNQHSTNIASYSMCKAYLGYYTSDYGATWDPVGTTKTDAAGNTFVALHPSAEVPQYWFRTNYVAYGGYNTGVPGTTSWSPSLGENHATGIQGRTLFPKLHTNLDANPIPINVDGEVVGNILSNDVRVYNKGIKYIGYSSHTILPYDDKFVNNANSATVTLSVTQSLLGVTLATGAPTELGYLKNNGNPYLINSPQYGGQQQAQVTSNLNAEHVESTGITLNLIPGVGIYQQNMDAMTGGVYPIVASQSLGGLGDAVGTYNNPQYCYTPAAKWGFARTVGWHIDNVNMTLTYRISVTMVYSGQIEITAEDQGLLGEIQGTLGNIVWDNQAPDYTLDLVLDNPNLLLGIIIIVAIAAVVIIFIRIKMAPKVKMG